MEVSAVVTLEEKVFDEELENKTSPKYQELERNVKQEVKNRKLLYFLVSLHVRYNPRQSCILDTTLWILDYR